MERKNKQRVLDFAVRAGEVLLKNGAEIFRVQETILRILRVFQLEGGNVFVLANGIFATVAGDEAVAVAVREIPIGDVHLARIAAVNALSREIAACEGPLDLAGWEARLEECAALAEPAAWLKLLACAASCAAFCYLTGGQLADCVAAFLAGVALQGFRSLTRPFKHSAFVTTILGAALVTLLCALLQRLGLGQSLDKMITGAIITLVPGIALTNAIRDLFHGDYLSGGARLTHALLQAICIAVGVGVSLYLWNWLGGV